jgi:hypothetical protein
MLETTARSRREVLGLLDGLGAVVLVAGCGSDEVKRAVSSSSKASTTTTTGARRRPGVASCSKIPEETAGPYPADGTNGPNILTEQGRRAPRHPVELVRRRASRRDCR